MNNKQVILKYSVFLAFWVICLAGCSSYSSRMNSMLNEQVCDPNTKYKVGSDRSVVLFVKHHIMVGKREVVRNRTQKYGFLHTSKEIISWENSRFATYRKETVPALMEGVNEIFYDNNTNIFLVNDGYEVNEAEDFFPADFDLLSKPQGRTKEIMEAIVAKDPEHIHILYGWTSSSAVVVAGEEYAVVVADDPRYGTRVASRDLARGIVNALGYQPDPGSQGTYNLLRDTSTGEGMSHEQVVALQNVVNEQGAALKSISCSPRKKHFFWGDED